MRNTKNLIGAIFAGLALLGCRPTPKPDPAPSTDKKTLLQIVDLSIPFEEVKWEAVVDPEETDDFLPDNYHGTILIAEIAPVTPQWFESNEEISAIWPIRHAPRRWLTASSRAILTNRPLKPHEHHCKFFSSPLKSGGGTAPGYACMSADRVLLYLVLDSRS